jgi:DNA-binding response OmpR family regulator
LFRVLIAAASQGNVKELSGNLSELGYACLIASSVDKALEMSSEPTLDLVVCVVNDPTNCQQVSGLIRKVKKERHLPVIALLARNTLGIMDDDSDIDDFAVEPWNTVEVTTRIRRVLSRTNGADNREIIRCSDLLIDPVQCEAYLAGQPVLLTFREFELLKFLASNRGRVFTRDALLNKVWGYDYFGGDRTVDVHIRRLRSKIEDGGHSFIETVRNIGYRFKKDNWLP